MVSVTRFAINTTAPGTQDDVQLARLTDGSVVAVWRSEDSGPTFDNIRAQHFDHLGNKLGTEFVANTEREDGLDSSVYFQRQPDIAALADGGYVVAYLDNRATTSSPLAIRNVLVGQRFDANDQRVGIDNSLVPVFKTGTTASVYGAKHPDLVGLPSGGYMMTYGAEPLSTSDAAADPDEGIRITGYTGNTPFTQAFGGDLFAVKTVNTLNAGLQRGAKIEGLVDISGALTGNSVVVWMTNTITPDGIELGWQMKAQIVTAAGERVGTEITIPRAARLSQGDNGERFDIAALSDGGFVVVFEQQPSTQDFLAGKRPNILYQIYNSDGSARGGLTELQATDGTTRAAPTAAANDDGTFMIAWDNDGTVKGQFFQSNGAKIGTSFDISNSAHSESARNPEAVRTGNGTYFVAWEDDGREYETGPGLVGAIVDPQGTTGGGTGANRIVSISGAATHTEGDAATTYNVTFTLDQIPQTALSAFYRVEATGPNPALGSDFGYGALPYQGQIQFAPGLMDITIPVPITGDLVAEGDKTFTVTLFDPSAGLILGQSVLNVTLLDNDAAGEKIGITVDGAYLAEQTYEENGTAGAVNQSFRIKLDKPSTKTETLTWSVLLGSPSESSASASDFKDGVVPSGTLTFLPGETLKTVIVPILADAVTEKNESFVLAASNPSSGLKLTDASYTTVIIADDDAPVSAVKLILPTGGAVLEGTSATTSDLKVTLKLEKASSTVQIVDWFTKIGGTFSTATADDFAADGIRLSPAGAAYFQPGEIEKVLTIPIIADALSEPDEFLTFSILNASSGIILPAVVDTKLFIIDDDSQTKTLSQTFIQNTDVAKGLAAAYQTLLGGIPTEAGFTFLIDTAIATNFGAGAGPVFNAENIYINLVNNLAQGNPAAKQAFALLAPGATLAAKIEAVYRAIIPAANQTPEGLSFITRAEGIAFYEAVAAERGVAGSDGAAIVALAALIKIATDQNIGIGSTLNALVNTVFAGTDGLPATGSMLTPLTSAIGTPPPIDPEVALVGSAVVFEDGAFGLV